MEIMVYVIKIFCVAGADLLTIILINQFSQSFVFLGSKNFL